LIDRCSAESHLSLRDELIAQVLASRSTAGATALSRAVGRVAGEPGAARQQTIDRLLRTLWQTERSQDVVALSQAALDLLATQPPDGEVARALLHLMMHPGAAAWLPKVAGTVRQLYAEAPQQEAGYWALMAWMQMQWPDLKLNRPSSGRPTLVTASARG